MKTFLKSLLIAAITLFTFSCKKDTVTPQEPTPTPTESLLKIGETYILGAKAKAVVYSDKALVTGYNVIYVALYDSIDGSRLSDGHFNVTPMMDMGSMMHSSPVENTEDTITTGGYFKTSVVFIMPGTSTEWSLNMMFNNHKNGLTGHGELGVDVVSSTPSKCVSTTIALDSNAKVFISLIGLANPIVGINDFEIVIHKKLGMMNFPAIENYTVEIDPEMPSMGHSSPNNVNPVHIGKGHYTGEVNFTMTGLWNVNLKIYKNGTLISSDQYFEITLH
ncbi:MAG: FixH family protein [Bacteroidetes bacterium]|nr:FixH family protein [Bacteroidota bacterium]